MLLSGEAFNSVVHSTNLGAPCGLRSGHQQVQLRSAFPGWARPALSSHLSHSTLDKALRQAGYALGTSSATQLHTVSLKMDAKEGLWLACPGTRRILEWGRTSPSGGSLLTSWTSPSWPVLRLGCFLASLGGRAVALGFLGVPLLPPPPRPRLQGTGHKAGFLLSPF